MDKNNALINFSNAEFGNVRAMLIDGEPWFVGKDVAKALGYKNPRDALKNHVPDKYKKDGVAIRDPIGREQKPVLINESGMYKLVFRSKLENAEKFSDWVCEDVLPSIRKTGSYSLVRDQRWFETRIGTKLSHHIFTDAIKLLIPHLRKYGETRKDNYIYGHLTNIAQNACGIRRGERDNAPVANLNKLDQGQSMIGNLILQLLATRPDIKTLEQFEATILLQLDRLNQLLGGHCPLLSGGSVA